MTLRPGDRLLLYTDGVPEAQNPRGDFLDAEGLRRWLAASDGPDAAHVADTALAHLRRWRGAAAFDDDVTLVVGQLQPDEPQPTRRNLTLPDAT